MGAFQIVYDDFSGGQYMGPRSANQPKNTWTGLDVLSTPTGELIPGGSILALRHTDVAGTVTSILDHWAIGEFGYIFAAAGSVVKLIRYQHTNGVSFPVTATSYSLAGSPIGNEVAYSSITSRFYYPSFVTIGSSVIYRVSTTGGNNTQMTGTLDRTILGVVSYNLRLVAWGGARLFYTGNWSGTDFGSWSSTQYYEFNSPIKNVFVRTDDLLVVCDDGVYSLTGVLGSSVNIQLIIPGTNTASGMQKGDVVNRSLYYVDDSGSDSGQVDGRLYRMIGASTQGVGSFQKGDYGHTPNGFVPINPGNVCAMSGGRIAVVFKSGYAYFETHDTNFARSKIHNAVIANNASGRYRIAKSGVNAPNEYMLLAVIDPAQSGKIDVYRTLTNVPEPTFVDANFNFSTSSTCLVKPSGTVTLPEYWHQKPFTVKEMFIEYAVAAGGGTISGYVEPTGLVDVAPANIAASVSNTAQELTPPVGGNRMYRYWPDSASKGFGMKPNLSITNCSVKRVIVNCED
jgi:hypothetical protein